MLRSIMYIGFKPLKLFLINLNCSDFRTVFKKFLKCINHAIPLLIAIFSQTKKINTVYFVNILLKTFSLFSYKLETK